MISARAGRSMMVVAALLASAVRQVHGQTPSDQPCPDATDTPDILSYYVGVAYRAIKTDATRPLPPPCLFAAIARVPVLHADSTISQSLVLTDKLLEREPNDAGLLETRVALLSRLKRYAEVGKTFERMIAVDPARATLQGYKSVIVAAERGGDTLSMIRYLVSATAKYQTAGVLSSELTALRDAPRLRALIDTVRGAMKADPGRTGGFASLASIYGSLGQSDSALAYVRRGRAAGESRATMGASERVLVGSLLRWAQLSDANDDWEATLPIAFEIDSVVSTPESKYLIAITVSHIAAYRTELLNFYMPPLVLGHGYGTIESIETRRPPTTRTDAACSSINSLATLMTFASERLASGGNQFAPETAPAIGGALLDVRSRLAPSVKACTGA